MTLDELIEELQEWQLNGMGQLPVFFRNFKDFVTDDYFDVAMQNMELTQIDNKLIFL